ncbi:TetR/AcrR family transcriptional regulator [Xanthobacter sp. KR7-225]|uniref:TetR/AcrR family transcriptional regulator n=1 Tax=Xanthobacter sp. KR7-225 TaxID=3156613 RepID=UPI0032B46414
MAAAMACFARDGFHGASMQKICAEAGMSPGALYRHFPSKEAIIAAIVEDERADRLHVFDEVRKAPTILGGLMGCLRQLLEEQTLPTATLGPEIMAEAIRNAPLRAAVEPCEEETRVHLRAALEEAVARGEIDPGLSLDEVMILLQIMGDGIILNHQLHPEWRITARLPDIHRLVVRMLAPAGREG